MKQTRSFHLLFVFVFALGSKALWATPPLEQIQATVARPDILCGNFRQQKKLDGIKAPLVSEGRFCVHAEKGILWRHLKPFEQTLRVTKDEIVMMQGGRVTNRLDANEEPMVRMINSVLLALVSGDIAPIQDLFDIDARIKSGFWNVSLRAKNPQLARAVSKVFFDGRNYVQTILIRRENGDETRIVFSGIHTGADALNPDEARLYE